MVIMPFVRMTATRVSWGFDDSEHELEWFYASGMGEK
jgi:hypothetical protein